MIGPECSDIVATAGAALAHVPQLERVVVRARQHLPLVRVHVDGADRAGVALELEPLGSPPPCSTRRSDLSYEPDTSSSTSTNASALMRSE
jgi:hypothetical protein